jgi:hypothetical protein
MLKKTVQQGRSERTDEEVQTALRVGRSPIQWILANEKYPPALPISAAFLLNVEPLNDASGIFHHPVRVVLNVPPARGTVQVEDRV